MTLLPPSVPSLATSPTTMPRASSFWRSACLQWQTSSKKGLTCQGWWWCDHYLSKTSRLWSRRWRSMETTSGRWTRFLPKMTLTRCWSTTTSAWGGDLRALGEILENVSREGQKGADAVIKRVEQRYKERVEPIERKLDDQEVKDYLLQVAGAGPMGYLPLTERNSQTFRFTTLNKNITASHVTSNLSCPSSPVLQFFSGTLPQTFVAWPATEVVLAAGSSSASGRAEQYAQ